MADDLASTPGTLQSAFLEAVTFHVRSNFTYPTKGLAYIIETDTNAEFVGDDKSLVHASLEAKVTWQPPNETEEIEGPFDIAVTVGSTFAWRTPDTSDEDILGWVEFNAQHLLWPYLRSYISIISGASGLPPLTIYTISAPRPTLGESVSPETSSSGPS